jgi:NAD(P)-dependent dehydrogenase (short-subunit alcohol dehydrogenase family)
MSNKLSGKVCTITGTGGSIGREAALIFAREGALVVGCGLRVDGAENTVEARIEPAWFVTVMTARVHPTNRRKVNALQKSQTPSTFTNVSR